MEKTKGNQSSLLAVFTVILAILAAVFYIVPQASAIKDLSNKIVQNEQELTAGQAKVSAAKQFAMVVKAAKADIEKLGISIPTEEKADEAVLQSASAASSAGITLVSVSVSGQSSTPASSASSESADLTSGGGASSGIISLTISTKGNYPATIEFVKKLEENIRPVTLKNMSIAVAEDGGDDIDGSFVLEFPFVKAATSTGSELETDSPEVNNAK